MSLVCLFLVSLLGVASAQEPPSTSSPDWNQLLRELSGRRVNTAAYRLGPGDLVEVHVFGVETLQQILRVSDEGTVNFPLLGAVTVAGLTPTEAETRIAGELERREFVQNPQVALLIKEYRSQPIFVLGAVRQPGQYQMTYPLRLIDALVLAGGVKEEVASDTVQLQRFLPEGAVPESGDEVDLLEVSLETLLSTGSPDTNVLLRAGDVIRIPERQLQVFYLIGEVSRPGVYELPPYEKLFLTQALAHAGGPLRTAKMSQGVLVRYGEQGRRTELALDVKKVINGQAPDLEVQPNDVIFVPGSTSKNILYGLLGSIPRTFSDAVTRAPTWNRRNP